MLDMSQQTIEATDKIVSATEVPVEGQPVLRRFPLPKVVIQATGRGKNAYGTIVSWWRDLPRERQRLIALVGLSVITSVAVSLIATVIARLFAKREKPDNSQ